MIDLTRSNSEYSVVEYLETLPNAAAGDGECLFRIVPAGQYLGFTGDELAEFVGLSVKRLLDSGAVPVLHAQDGPMKWVEQTPYGSTNEERANTIVAEWLGKGGGQPDWGDLWFVMRDVLETTRRHRGGVSNSD